MSRALQAVLVVVVLAACALAFAVGRTAADDTPVTLRAVPVDALATPTVGPKIVLPPKAVVR